MMRLEIDGEYYACPFASIVRPLTTAEAAALEASIQAHGIISRIDWYYSPTHGRAIIDGVNRVVIGLKYAKEIPLNPPRKVTDVEAKQLAIEAFARRHLTTDELQTLRGKRILRVVAARSEGKSFRAIAQVEGVTHTQVQRDYDAAVSGGTPVPPVASPRPEPASPPSPTVTGTDGKRYPAVKPKRNAGPHLKRAHRHATQLAASVKAVLRGPHRGRLETIAAVAGIPFDGTDWPALSTITAVLRDVLTPGASV